MKSKIFKIPSYFEDLCFYRANISREMALKIFNFDRSVEIMKNAFPFYNSLPGDLIWCEFEDGLVSQVPILEKQLILYPLKPNELANPNAIYVYLFKEDFDSDSYTLITSARETVETIPAKYYVSAVYIDTYLYGNYESDIQPYSPYAFSKEDSLKYMNKVNKRKRFRGNKKLAKAFGEYAHLLPDKIKVYGK